MFARSNKAWGCAKRLMFALMMMLAWAGAPQAARAQQQKTEADAAAAQAASQRVERVLQAVRALSRATPGAPLDAADVVAVAGRDPAALLAWVRDNTEWVPYRGALRGPSGVILDRVANSLDRALLLAELLRATGQSVRLARTRLDDQVARDAVAKLTLSRKLSAAPSAAAEVDAERLRTLGIDPKLLKAALETSEAVRNAAVGRIETQSRQLSAAIGAPADDPAPRTAAAVDAMKDHWWVQCRNGDSWVDLDPLLDQGRGDATETIAYDRSDGQIPLASSLCHEIEIRVIAERWDGDTPAETTLLSYPLRPAEVIGKTITLLHAAVGVSEAPAGGGTDDASKLEKEFLAQDAWRPVLQIGRVRAANLGITANGAILAREETDPRAKLGQAAGGLFGGGLTGETAEAKAGAFTAEWIEFEIRSPGREARVVRRDVFDLIGPAARAARAGGSVKMLAVGDPMRLTRATALGDRIQSTVPVCRLPRAFGEARAMRTIAAREAKLRDAAAQPDPAKRAQLGEDALCDVLIDLSAPVNALAQARWEWSSRAGDLYFDQPNVLTYRDGLRIDKSSKPAAVTSVAAFDVAHNEVGVRLSVADAFTARLEQGVADTAAEKYVLNANSPAVGNTTDAFAAAGDAAPLVIRPGAGATDAKLAPDPAARLARTLADGYAAVLPANASAAGPTAWWRIDPATGSTVGVLDNGLHGGIDERAELEIKPLDPKALRYLEECARRSEQRFARKMLMEKIGYGMDVAAVLVMSLLAGVFFMLVFFALLEGLAPPKAPGGRSGGSRG